MKYERFKNVDTGEIIEDTGLTTEWNGGRKPVYKKVSGGTGVDIIDDGGGILIVDVVRLFKEEWKQITPARHPLIDEIIVVLQENPDFRHELARVLVTLFSASNPADKEAVIEILRKTLPEKQKMSLLSNELSKCLNEGEYYD